MYSVVAERLVRLVLEADHRPLTDHEQQEYMESKQYLKNFYREKEKLAAMSYIAYTTEDYEWQHEICSEMEKLKGE
ncbi:hypothetical protein HUG15_15990 [Salicibibacter cibarius]|uniref:Uncharacterized protein n=1 Tax=Salicibibacter cibarius TaxID=2743000 RepID=A0A7T6Z4V7_9BACI|nr:hypothetical protein [Salicibibacter cibarius]QQK76921.1 hypothetical protein HUG15_15990 [Salicibibacter cibarius]